MKSPTFKLFFVFLAGYILTGCMATTQIRTLQPAAFKVPSHVKTILTVNRSVPTKKGGDFFEGAFSGELPGQDRIASNSAIQGLTQGLTQTPRFNVKHTGTALEGGGIFNFPPPLPWPVVDNLCDSYDADALASIEKFDSDIFARVEERERKKKTSEGKEVHEKYFRAEMRTNVKMGWRLYDRHQHKIIDEFDVHESLEWSTTGKTEEEARKKLPDPIDAITKTAYEAGLAYAMRIAPTWVWVERPYYTRARGYEAMKQAAAYAKNNQWEKAAQIWQAIYNNADDQKAVGKAAYNLAVAAEVNGNLDLALDWAQIAANQYNNKKARAYLQELNRRIADEQIAHQQLTD